MVKHLITKATSKDGKRIYATDSKGNAFFPNTPAIGEKLVDGCWANVVERTRTQTLNDKGELVNLEHPVVENIITAVFPDKNAALEANTADAVFELESRLFVASKTAELATAYKLDPKTLEAAL